MQWALELSSGKRFVGIAAPQVKFLGVAKMVPGCILFVYNFYVIFSYLPLQYHCLSSVLQSPCTYSQQFFDHITQISFFSFVPAAISQLHCSLLSSCWALLLILSFISQMSTSGMCRHLGCYHFICTMEGSHITPFPQPSVVFWGTSFQFILKILQSFAGPCMPLPS